MLVRFAFLAPSVRVEELASLVTSGLELLASLEVLQSIRFGTTSAEGARTLNWVVMQANLNQYFYPRHQIGHFLEQSGSD